MRTLKLKATRNGDLVLAHPAAQPSKVTHNAGTPAGYVTMVYAITDIPDDVDDASVIRVASGTVFLRHGFDDSASAEKMTYKFDELGCGKIVR